MRCRSTALSVPGADTEAAVALTQEPVRPRTDNTAGATDVERPAVELVRLITDFGRTYEVLEAVPGRPGAVAVVGSGGGDGPTAPTAGGSWTTVACRYDLAL
ncbi:hypothetical protein ACFC4G_04675 [Streptomyces sp. NPDC056002]|uniref:hypothetical protein n=1 Tax=unclassified Streptomyces TaxID=2593676 RepID=UPI0035D639AF